MAKIEDAIVDLLVNNGTFYASLISQMHKISTDKIPTMGVTVKNGRIMLYHNPEFTDTLTLKETKAVLEHECLHLVMDHIVREKDRQHTLWNVATDVTINQMISGLPKDCLTISNVFGTEQDKQAYNVQREETADYYYDLLNKQLDKIKKQIMQMIKDGKLGDHSKWEEASATEIEAVKETIKQAVKEAVDSTNKQHGHMPSGIEKYIDELLTPPKVSWKQLLKQFVANSVKAGTKSSWKRPSRRYGDDQKGKISDRTIALTLALDTSGSIDDGMLNQFMSEVASIQSSYRIEINMLECDAEVGRHYKLKKYQKPRRDITGRGGTSFEPVFEYVKQKCIKTDALIYFTDLAGTFPDKAPRYPVMWAYYDTYGWSKPTAPFGRIVTLEKEKQNASR
jgi:predicted metal-dependent peptidase